MAGCLAALMGTARAIPLLGDDDGGRLFHPYGQRDRFCRATLATCAILLNRRDWYWEPADLHEQAAWWLGADVLDTPPPSRPIPESRLFSGSGLAVLTCGDSDTLSIIVRAGEEEILIDPGAYTYVSEPRLRDWFRGSAAHNTLRIDSLDQAIPVRPFAWTGKPSVQIHNWSSTPEQDQIEASCAYRGFIHRRSVTLHKPGRVSILDEVQGPPGEHLVEQFWHPGAETHPLGSGRFRIGARAVLATEDGQLSFGGEHGWKSPVFGKKVEAPVIRVVRAAGLPVRLVAEIEISGRPA
jgi:hypothetical protein